MGPNESNTWRIQTKKESNKKEIDVKTEELKADLQKAKEEQLANKKEEDGAWSSGIESDNDFDLLVEQEVL